MTDSRISDYPTLTDFPPAPATVSATPTTEPAVTQVASDLEQRVYELVRARVLESIGAGGNWTVAFRRGSDDDTFFSDTMADMIAWDVAARLTPPAVPNRARLAG